MFNTKLVVRTRDQFTECDILGKGRKITKLAALTRSPDLDTENPI